MANITCKLIKGIRTLNLSSGNYRLADDFVAPAVALAPIMAQGTSANRRGGSRVGLRETNRAWSFGVHITGCASEGEVTRALSALAYMLAQAGDEAEHPHDDEDDGHGQRDPLHGRPGLDRPMCSDGAPPLA